MINAPLFFKAVFNREDNAYNKYSVVVSENLFGYDLMENNTFVMRFNELPMAIQYFEDEFHTGK